MKNCRLRLWLHQNERLSRAKRAAARMPCREDMGKARTAESDRRCRLFLRWAPRLIEQAEVEVTGLKADLAKARAASAPWLQLQQDNKKTGKADAKGAKAAAHYASAASDAAILAGR